MARVAEVSLEEWMVDQSMLNMKWCLWGIRRVISSCLIGVRSLLEVHQLFDGCCVRPRAPVVHGAAVA